MSRTPTFGHRAEDALLRGVTAAGRLLGRRAADALGGALGRTVYRPFGVRRAVVEGQLRKAFPRKSEEWIAETARAAYAHLGREVFSMLRLSGLGPEAVVQTTEVDGIRALRESLRSDRGAVLVTGHFGNWEIGGAALAARGVPIDVVAQRQSNPLVNRRIEQTRRQLGMRVIHRGPAAVRPILRALRSGRVVAFVADQDARRAGIFVPFFGRPASTHRGPALFALRTDAPLFLGTALRGADGRHRIRLEEVEVERAGETEAAVRRLTAAYTERLESAVRGAPEQYFWHHRRWKTRP